MLKALNEFAFRYNSEHKDFLIDQICNRSYLSYKFLKLEILRSIDPQQIGQFKKLQNTVKVSEIRKILGLLLD